MDRNWNHLKKGGRPLIVGLVISALLAGCGGGGGGGTTGSTNTGNANTSGANTPATGGSSALTLAGSVNSSLAIKSPAVVDLGPTAKSGGFFSMYDGSSSATYQSLTSYAKIWSTNATLNNSTNTLMVGDAVLRGDFYVDQTTGAIVLAPQGFICNTNSCSISSAGTTVFALGKVSAGGCLVGTGASPSCASAGIDVNRSAGTISFTNTPMVTGTVSSTGTLTASGSATLNGTLTFTPF